MRPMSDYERARSVALEAVREAAVLCRRVQASVTAAHLEKKDKSPVTVADFGSQALICRRLAEAFPEDPIMAEEGSAALRELGNEGLLARVVEEVTRVRPEADAAAVCAWIDRGSCREQRPRFWTLDPIDGTKGFLRGDNYAVALALIVDCEVVASALASPNLPVRPDEPEPRGMVFHAVRGQGARGLPLDEEGGEIDLQVSAQEDITQARFCESYVSEHSDQDQSASVAEALGITAAPVRLDSMTKYALVACGRAEIYLRLPRAGYRENVWDHAAGALVLTEAGGRLTDAAGNPVAFRHGEKLQLEGGLVASSGRWHERILEAVRATS